MKPLRIKLYQKLKVLQIDDLHLSDQGNHLIDGLTVLDERPRLKPKTEYYLQIKDKTPNRQYLVLEYADQVMQNSDDGDLIQGQILTNQKVIKDIVRISANDEAPLKILEQSGGFGFCVIACPDEWDLKEAFNLPETELLTVQDLQSLIKKIRAISIKENNIDISLYDHVVPDV